MIEQSSDNAVRLKIVSVLTIIDTFPNAHYNSPMGAVHLGGMLKQQRMSLAMTLQELAAKTGVSASYLGRMERGERFPSAVILRKIAGPLGFEEDELFTVAGYLSSEHPGIAEKSPYYGCNRLDPYVANLLAQEPVEIQRAVIGILSILKGLARNVSQTDPPETDDDEEAKW